MEASSFPEVAPAGTLCDVTLRCVIEFCCDVKAAISSAITDGACRLDLGKLEIGDGGHVMEGSWVPIKTKCCENRMPPLLPETVRKLLEQEKTFTTKSDVGSVAELYQRFFDDVSTSVEELR